MAQKLRPQAETLSGSPQPNFIGYATAPIISKRAPTTSDLGYPLGQEWIDKTAANSYQLVQVGGGVATWTVLGGSSSSISTINGLSPTAGNITIAGTANQLTVSNAGSTVTLSLPAAITAPGSLTTTTTLASGTTLTAGTSMSATTTITAGTGLTVTTGNVTLSAAGGKLSINAGANASIGTSAALSGTPGTVTVATTAVTASSKIFVTRNTVGGTLGNLSVPTASIVAGTSFDINSDANETSTINWWIVN